MKRIALLLAATAFTAPAVAADITYQEPMAPMAPPVAIAPVESGWSGFYLGLQGGGAFNPTSTDPISVGTSFGAPVTIGGVDQFDRSFSESNSSGFVGGGHVGYDMQFDRFVLGGILDIQALDYSENSQVVSRTADALYRLERDLDWYATARLRAGYLITPSVLAYATGGVAYGETDTAFVTTNTGQIGSLQVGSSETDWGYSVGGGLETKITDNLSFGTEYLYTNLGSSSTAASFSSGPFAGAAGTGITTFSNDDDFDFHTIQAKLSYRFN